MIVMADLCLSVSEAFLFLIMKCIPSPIFSTSSLCSFSLVLISHFVSAIYFQSQLLQSMVYTSSLGSTLSLGWINSLLKVVHCFISIMCPLFIRIQSTFCISPFTYGRTTITILSCSSLYYFLSVFYFCAILVWTDVIAHCGSPQTFKASLMVSLSCALCTSSNTILSHLSMTVLITPIF